MALALIHGRESVTSEIIIERPDGSRRIALAHANPLRDETGRITAGVNVFVDITARQNPGTARHRADRDTSEFLALLAHELRNPLAPMSLAVSLLPSAIHDPARLDELCSVLQRHIDRISRLIDDLFDISRIGHHTSKWKLKLNRQRLDLRESLDAAIASVRPVIAAAGQTLTVAHAPTPLIVEVDPVRMAQIFSNLLTNATTHTPAGGHIELHSARQGPEAVVRVRDSGIGISPARLDTPFDLLDPFDAPPPHAAPGLGMGLSLVKDLVALHGGTIHAASAGLGRGSEFAVRLPLLVESRAFGYSAAPRIAPKAPLACLRVLVVEDHPIVAKLFGEMLANLGQQVKVVPSAETALATIAEFTPDILFSDISMPGMNGYELAREVRKTFGPAMHLVALTGFCTPSDRKRALESGFDRHVAKPIELADLSALIDSVAGHSPATSPPSSLRR